MATLIRASKSRGFVKHGGTTYVPSLGEKNYKTSPTKGDSSETKCLF